MALKTPKEQAASDSLLFFNSGCTGVETVVYTQKGGSPVEIDGAVSFFGAPEDHHRGQRDYASVFVQAIDISAPAYGDTALIRGAVWRVLRVAAKTVDLFELELEKNLRAGMGD